MDDRASKRLPGCTAADTTPVVSVVVPTLRRPELLSRCLKALLTQDFPPGLYEILVCDDGPDDCTEREVRALVRAHPHGPELQYLPATGARGPAAARNRGWRRARSEIIAFTDDDTVAHADWLKQGVLAMTPATSAVSGRIVMPLPTQPTDYERDAAGLADAEFATANCFVRRRALLSVGGFDTRFTSAWREDSDLHFALLENDLIVVRCPLAQVLHPIRPARFGAGLAMQRKVMFDTLLLNKYPELYRERIRRGPPWFYLAVTSAAVVAVVALLLPLWWLAGGAGLLWLVLTAIFFRRRAQGTSSRIRDRLDLALTSALVPLLSIGWRLVGMARFGPRFP